MSGIHNFGRSSTSSKASFPTRFVLISWLHWGPQATSEYSLCRAPYSKQLLDYFQVAHAGIDGRTMTHYYLRFSSNEYTRGKFQPRVKWPKDMAALSCPCYSILSLGTHGKKPLLQPNVHCTPTTPPPPTPLIASKWRLSAILGAKPFPPSKSRPSSPRKLCSYTFASARRHGRAHNQLNELSPRRRSRSCASICRPLAMPFTASLLTMHFSTIRILWAQLGTCRQLKEACLRNWADPSPARRWPIWPMWRRNRKHSANTPSQSTWLTLPCTCLASPLPIFPLSFLALGSQGDDMLPATTSSVAASNPGCRLTAFNFLPSSHSDPWLSPSLFFNTAKFLWPAFCRVSSEQPTQLEPGWSRSRRSQMRHFSYWVFNCFRINN